MIVISSHETYLIFVKCKSSKTIFNSVSLTCSKFQQYTRMNIINYCQRNMIYLVLFTEVPDVYVDDERIAPPDITKIFKSF